MICRVCLRLSKCPLHIFDDGLNIAAILRQHFWFEPMPNDGSAELICHSCWIKIRDFHEFYLEVEKVHSELRAKHPIEIAFVVGKETTAGLDVKCSGDTNVPKSEPQEELWQKEENEVEVDPVEIEPIKAVQSELAYNPLHIPELEATAAELDATKLHSIEPQIEITTDVSVPQPQHKRIRCKRKAHKDEPDAETVEAPKPKRRARRKDLIQDDEIIRKHIPMGCDICTFVADDFRHLSTHFAQLHPDVAAYVMCCDRKLNKRYVILQHAYKHEDPEFFKCQECQKNFSDTYVLRAHILAAHAPEDELQFACDECPKRFSRRYMLEKHKPSHIPLHQREFICNQCPEAKAFGSRHLLLIHVNMRHTKVANVCHVCAKEIRDNRSYEKHVRLHFEDSGPRIKCPLPDCDRWLKDEDNLKEHLRRRHDEHKELTCDECEKVCKNRRALMNHLKYAHTNTVFACEECNKKFKRPIALKEHMAQHTGESLYRCPFCPRTFNSSANMHTHKKKKHPVEWDIWRRTKRGSSQQVASNQLVVEVETTNTNNDTINDSL